MLITSFKKRLQRHRYFFMLFIPAFSICILALHSFSLFYVTIKDGFIHHSTITEVVIGPNQSEDDLFKKGVLFQSSPQGLINMPKLSSKYVDLIVPITLGDSHRGHKVIATEKEFFSLSGDDYKLQIFQE